MGDRVFKDIDVLVIGGGIAGSMAAIKAKDSSAKRVVQVDKSFVGKSGASCFAAGVSHVYFPQQDDLNDRVRRLVRSLGYLAQQDLVQVHMEQSYENLLEHESLGVTYIKDEKGKIERQAGRGAYPVVKFHGPDLMDSLRKAVLKKRVEVVNRAMITDLVLDGGKCAGAVGFDARTGEFLVFEARSTVLAAGSTFYKGRSPGHRDLSGDGFAIAYRAGAALSGAEATDAPTNVMPALFDIGPGMNMYMGLGARLINRKGERFIEKYAPAMKERSGLMTINAAFCLEVKQGNAPLKIDMTHFGDTEMAKLKGALPLAMTMYERAGLVVNNRFVSPIDWMVIAPFTRPGVVIDSNYHSTIPGLFACGENAAPQAVVMGIAAASVSGANAGRSAAIYARNNEVKAPAQEIDKLRECALAPLQRKGGVEPDQIILAVQEVVLPYDVILLRHGKRLEKALEAITEIRETQLPLLCAYDPHYLRMAHEARNMALVAEIHIRTSLERTESRTVLREDYPFLDNENWLKWIYVRQDKDGIMKLNTVSVPIEKYPLQVERKCTLHHLWQLAQQQGIVTVEKGEIAWVSAK